MAKIFFYVADGPHAVATLVTEPDEGIPVIGDHIKYATKDGFRHGVVVRRQWEVERGTSVMNIYLDS